ncbi:MAG TPA: hypothetical protein VK925_12475 [Jiangellaceae bacterium]|nr:hypothetical protein [Jiangellaceae bacterium]
MRRRLVAAVAMAFIVAGCSSAASPSTEPSSTQATANPLVGVSPSPSAVASPQDAALGVYLAYTDAVVTALREGDAQVPALTETAAGQALRNARARVTANAGDGVVVTGRLEPSATTAQVEVTDGGGRAEITDCVLNGLAQVDTDNPDDVTGEATGWRQPVHATVTRADNGWRVTRVRVPRRDDSGPVPPPTGEAPLLRGPAHGQAPPSCVPAGLEADLIDRYLELQRRCQATGVGHRCSSLADVPS